MAKLEKRFSTEIRFETEGRKIVGYAAKFMTRSQDLGGFVVQIEPSAFQRSLDENADVRALIDHNSSLILGRTLSGTLKLSTDSTGLLVEITPPDTSYSRDLMVSLERGDITQMSFAFVTKKDNWEKDGAVNLRTLLDVDLHDVSAVTYPAYLDTEVGLRSLSSFLAEKQEDVLDIQKRINQVKLMKLLTRAKTGIVVSDIDNTLLVNGTQPVKKSRPVE
jgi:HK97 family phage prohead protease